MTQVLPAGFTGTTLELGSVPQKTRVTGLPVVNLGNVTGNPFVVDMTPGPALFVGLLTGNATLSIQNLTTARSSVIRLTQDATGGRTLAWNGAGGQAITPVGSTDMLSMPTAPNTSADFALTFNGAGVALCVEHGEPQAGLLP